jgi:hypothetical protein
MIGFDPLNAFDLVGLAEAFATFQLDEDKGACKCWNAWGNSVGVPSITQRPCIVTFREVQRVFTGREANEALSEAARKEPSPEEQRENTKTLAQLAGILKALQKAQDDVGRPDVMATPQHAAAARLQSLIASGEAAELKFIEHASGALEAQFDTHDWLG